MASPEVRQAQWRASGVAELLAYVVNSLASPETVYLSKLRTALGQVERGPCAPPRQARSAGRLTRVRVGRPGGTVVVTMRASLERRRMLLDRKLALVEATRQRTADFEAAVLSDLHARDLAVADEALARTRRAVVGAFERYTVPQLVLQYETMADQLYTAVFGPGPLWQDVEHRVKRASSPRTPP
jgi:hypothetical protein